MIALEVTVTAGLLAFAAGLGRVMATTWEGGGFDTDADLTQLIFQALNSADAAATIGDQWPWMRGKDATDNFVALAIPLQNAGNGEELEPLVERFDYVIKAYWGDQRDRARRGLRERFGWLRWARP